MEKHPIAILKSFFMPIARGIGVSATRIYNFLRHRPHTAALVILVLTIVFGASYFFETPESEVLQTIRSVSLVRVGDQNISAPLSIIGEVRSVKEAFVSPDSSGTVSNVYRTLGDHVSVGTAIASLKNDRERAAVTQAEAALAKAKAGAAISGIGVGTALNTLTTATKSAMNAIQSSRTTISDVILRRTDGVFYNPAHSTRTFIVTASAFELTLQTVAKRSVVQDILNKYTGNAADPVGIEKTIEALEEAQKEVAVVYDYLDTLSQTLVKAIATVSITEADIATFRAETNASLATVTALETSLLSAEQSLRNAEANVSIADQRNADIGGENASVIAAKAALQNAQIALNRTIIRAPISGTINRLDIKIGDFASAGSQIAYITNSSGLEIVAYVSSRDIGDIVRGAQAEIEGALSSGTVTRVATALDPATKKAEIRVALPAGSVFVSGLPVTLSIERRASANNDATIFLPVTSVKLTPDGADVFTVSDANILEAHPVTLGRLEGARVEITYGLDKNWYIVEDARGLADGESVIVNE